MLLTLLKSAECQNQYSMYQSEYFYTRNIKKTTGDNSIYKEFAEQRKMLF